MLRLALPSAKRLPFSCLFCLPLPPFFCMCGGVKRLWICSVTAKEPRVSVRVGVCGPGSKHESRGDGGAGRIKGIRGRDWERLIKARRRRVFNEQLDPINRGQQQPSKSPPPSPSSSVSVRHRHCRSHLIASVYQCPQSRWLHSAPRRLHWQPAAGSPPTPPLIWQPQLMLNLQRRAAAHMRSRGAARTRLYAHFFATAHREFFHSLLPSEPTSNV